MDALIELPHSEQAEAALLSTCLAHPKQLDKVKDIIRPGDFYRESHRWAWEAMQAIQGDGMVVNATSLADRLYRAGRLDTFTSYHSQVTGVVAITNMMTSDRANVRDIDTLVAIIKNLAGKRSIYYLLQRNVEPTLNGKPSRDILKDIATELGEIELMTGGGTSEILSMGEALTKAANTTEKMSKGGTPAIRTGLVDLDAMIGGWRQGDYITIAGRPGDGKTSFLLTTATHAAYRQGKRVGIFSLEMTVESLTNRIVSQESGLNGEKIRDGLLLPDEWPIYYDWVGRLEVAKISICDAPGLDIPRLRTFARKMAYSGLDLLIVDYLGLVTPGKRENRVQEVSEITRNLKLLARELKVPVICACQMNRGIETRAEKVPQLSDLRESGSIEQDSDMVIFIYKKSPNELSKVSMKIAKHRNGRIGEVDAFFNATTTKFCNQARP